jgi:hypothetical protein
MHIPIVTITSDDVVQSSIRVSQMSATNERFRVDFDITDAGAKKLREFFEKYKVEIRQGMQYRIGRYEYNCQVIGRREKFGRQGFWCLSEDAAKMLEAGLKGQTDA